MRKDGVLLLLFCFIAAFFVFKDTGVLVSDYNTGDIVFKDGERVEIVRTKDNIHTVLKGEKFYEIPFSIVLKLTASAQVFETKIDADVYDGVDGVAIKKVTSGTNLDILKAEGDYGLFSFGEDERGYFRFEDLNAVEKGLVTEALLLEDTVVDNGTKKAYLKKFSTVYINNYSNGSFTIQDSAKNYFSISKDIVKLATEEERLQAANRSSTKRVSKDVSGLIEFGKAQIGKKYTHGTAGPDTFDCSGFTSYVYKNVLGIRLSRSSKGQIADGTPVEKQNLRQGDLVFFNTTGKGISHVGIYVGDGNFIHSSSTNRRGVRIDTLASGYYEGRYVTARRILK